MHRLCLITALLVVGCSSPAEPDAAASKPPVVPMVLDVPVDEPVALPTTQISPTTRGKAIAVATVADVRVTLSEEDYDDFLRETRGLDAALQLMQRELAREQAKQLGLTLTDEDMQNERNRTLAQAFGDQVPPDQYEQAMTQLLARQGISRAEFDVTIETNALLRKGAGPTVDRGLTDEMLRAEFGRRYGERASIRVISVPTLREAAEVRQRLDAGEAFETLARELNSDPVLSSQAGKIEPFTRESSVPLPLKQAMFNLKPGDVSDAVQSEGAFVVAKLEEILPPTAVEYDNVKDELREQITVELADQIMVRMRQTYAQLLSREGVLDLRDEVLARQFADRLALLRPQPTETDELRDQMERQRPTTEPAPSTRSGLMPTTAPATQPTLP